ncbi:proton channel OtopLc isoform X2 [Lepeophtheirus salmonis]|nr:proton channel OtopLc-like isoform X2 [Lepeophtheirus salmonis]
MDEESPLIIGNPYSMNSFVIEDKQEDMQEGKQEDKPNVKDEDEGLHFKDIESEPKYARVNKNKDQNLKDIIQPLSPTKSNSGRFPSTLSSTPLEDVAETNSGESTPPSTNSSSQQQPINPIELPQFSNGAIQTMMSSCRRNALAPIIASFDEDDETESDSSCNENSLLVHQGDGIELNKCQILDSKGKELERESEGPIIPRLNSNNSALFFSDDPNSSLVSPLKQGLRHTSTTSFKRVRQKSNVSYSSNKYGQVLNPSNLDLEPEDAGKDQNKKGFDALESVVSALYCKIIIIFGLAFPMSEVISSNVPPGYYQLFYIYLFLGSLAYLIIIYVDLLRTRASIAVTRTKLMMKAKKCETENSLKRTISGSGETEEDDYNLSSSAAALSAINYKDGIPRPRVHYGSFYLRFGAVIFGIGSMIYSGIEIGMVFELNMANVSKCKNIFSIIRPILQMIFVFVQMYFIFLNQKMNIYKSKLMSRFGLMHMIATNICVWFNVLILETSHEILGHGPHHHTNGDGTQPTPISDDHSSNDSHHSNGGQHTQIPEAHYLTDEVPNSDYSKGMEFQLSHLVSMCQRENNIMSKLLSDSGPFLFPCTIEYSLICAAVLFVMWKNIAEEHEHYKFQRRRRKISAHLSVFNPEIRSNLPTAEEERSAHQYSVDCTHANTGLFTGIFVMVITIISLIVFFVLMSSPDPHLNEIAVTVASLTELSLYVLTILAVIMGMIQVRTLWYDTSRKMELDNLLLIVAQTGVFMYAAFCIIGSFFQLRDHLIAFLASMATLVQTTLQTVFILDCSCRFAYNPQQVKSKSGREVVTFLLVCNLAMWAINTLETNRADSHPIQVKFYGGEWAWPIITHVSMPLAIFYRFHSTVCLCEIWKKSFKYKPSNLAFV